MVKQLLLWAALALSPVALAHPAKAADPLSKATLASDYLERELGARLTPLPGKPFLPGQSSKNQYSPEQMAAVRAVLGADSPLQVKRLPAATGSSYSITLPAGQYQDSAENLAWETGSLVARTQRDGSVTVRGQMAALRIADKVGATNAKGIRFESSQQRDYWSGKSEVMVDTIDISPADPKGVSGSFEQFRHRLHIERDGKGYGGRLEFGIGRLLLGGHGVENVQIAARLHQLDPATLGQLHKEGLARQAKGGTGRDSFDVLSRNLPAIKRLAMRGATLELEQFSLRYKGHELAISGSFAMPNASEAEFASWAAVLNKLHAKLDVTVPLSLLRQIANDIAISATGKGKQEISPAELGARIYEKQVGDLIAKQYAWREKDMLRTTLELQAGVLKVNGQAVPLAVLLAALGNKDGSQTPPADYSAPVTLSMRERGLEVAEVFALNGDVAGQFDLCDRYLNGIGVAKDTDAAVRWCQKAYAEGSGNAARALARLKLQGRYHGDFQSVLARLQEQADNDGSREAQFLMSRLLEDREKADAYLRSAAAKGFPEALALLPGSVDETKDAPSTDSPWQLELEAAAGHYDREDYQFERRMSRHLRISLDDIKRHEKWAPMAGICLNAVMPSDAACLRLQADANTNRVTVSAELIYKGGSNKPQRKALKQRFEPGEVIDVVAWADDYQAYFAVNGGAPLVLDIGFPAETISFPCSGGTCRVEFQRTPE